MGRVLAGYGLFGLFWGAWGAVLPALQRQAGVGDGALGATLLLVGLGALGSMRLTGHLLDRYGRWVAPAALVSFAACGAAAGAARSPAALARAGCLLGASSGAVDGVIGAAAVGCEAGAGRPVMSMAHASFSGAVVVSSALTGLARSAHAGPLAVLGTVAVLLVAAVPVFAGPGRDRTPPADRARGRIS